MARGSSVSDNEKKYLLWDFGNTIAQLKQSWAQLAIEIVQPDASRVMRSLEVVQDEFSKGFPWRTPEQSHTHIGSADEWWQDLFFPMFRQVLILLEVHESRFDDLSARFRQACLKPEAWEVYPDVHSTLKTLSSFGWTHVMVSNHVPELETLVQRLGLRHHFEQVFTSGIIGFEKPNPKFFEFVLSRLDRAEQTWMIGDNHAHDIVGAAQFGIPGILIGKPRADVEHACPDLEGVIEIVRGARAA